MSYCSIGTGLAIGIRNFTSIVSSAIFSKRVRQSGINPMRSLYVSWESPSGFGSWLHPAYATTSNLALASAGFDTTYAPLFNTYRNCALTTLSLGGGFLSGCHHRSGFGLNLFC